MKKYLKLLIMIAGVTIIMLLLIFRHNDPPGIVVDAFNNGHPGIHQVKWKKFKDGYIAIFRMNNRKTKIAYSPEGSMMTSKTILKTRDLPATIQAKFVSVIDGERSIRKSVLMIRSDGSQYYLTDTDQTRSLWTTDAQFVSRHKIHGETEIDDVGEGDYQ